MPWSLSDQQTRLLALIGGDLPLATDALESRVSALPSTLWLEPYRTLFARVVEAVGPPGLIFETVASLATCH